MRVPRPDGKIMHAEVLIGDAIVEMADGNEQYPSRPMPIHVYVRDIDAAYHARSRPAQLPTTRRRIRNTAITIAPCAIAFGNFWYIGSRERRDADSGGVPSLMPFVHAVGTQKLIDFMKSAFAAEELMKVQAPDGVIVHAKMRFGGDAVIELSEARRSIEPLPGFVAHVRADADEVYARAIAAGAKPLTPLGGSAVR